MRTVTPLKEWLFCKKDLAPEALREEKDWLKVTLPHTWNNLDGQDGGNDYYRGACWYVCKLEDYPADGRLFLEFCGANSICDVYVNGVSVGHHEGGFSRFRVDVTEAVRSRESAAAVAVRVDNGESDHVYPQFADFTFFGGLYREVNLISVPETHFNLDYYAAQGIYVESEIKGENADISVHAFVKNPKAGQTLRITAEGDNAPDFESIALSEGTTEVRLYGKIQGVHRWNGRKDPYLYHLKAVLSDETGELDRVELDFGVREFFVDPEKGFFLNGQPYPLRGVCRHQDRLNKGWAIGKKEHEEDIDLIMEVGATTIRLAHYQHDDYFYTLCDRKGLVIWAEIPFISAMLPDGQDNETRQMKELVLQNYNHASIVCWGLSNEVTIKGVVDEELIRRHKELNNLCKSLDPHRLTTMAQVSMLPVDSPMNEITDLRSYNIYYGWYGGTVEDNGPFIDSFHAAHPTLALGISEYGCEADVRWHSETPDQGDYTEEYQAYYHEQLLETFMSRPYLWATHVWNMFDFASDMRNEGGTAGRNQKGLVTFDRSLKKDAFYIYKAWWSDEPFVHLCGSRFVKHASKTVMVKVYSNQKKVALYVNGKLFAEQEGEHVFTFPNVPLRFLFGTKIEAVSGGCSAGGAVSASAVTSVSGEVLSDSMKLRRVFKPYKGYKLSAAGGKGVDNWFDEKLSFPEGYFSIHDKVGAIMQHPEGAEVFEELFALAKEKMGDKMPKVDASMMKMASSFTVERILGMLGEKIPKEAIVELNEKLNKIKK